MIKMIRDYYIIFNLKIYGIYASYEILDILENIY